MPITASPAHVKSQSPAPFFRLNSCSPGDTSYFQGLLPECWWFGSWVEEHPIQTSFCQSKHQILLFIAHRTPEDDRMASYKILQTSLVSKWWKYKPNCIVIGKRMMENFEEGEQSSAKAPKHSTHCSKTSNFYITCTIHVVLRYSQSIFPSHQHLQKLLCLHSATRVPLVHSLLWISSWV